VTGPRLLVADEAVSALDVSVQAQVPKLFEEIRARLAIAMLFSPARSTHTRVRCSRRRRGATSASRSRAATTTTVAPRALPAHAFAAPTLERRAPNVDVKHCGDRSRRLDTDALASDIAKAYSGSRCIAESCR
jgi:hypothetical protein